MSITTGSVEFKAIMERIAHNHGIRTIAGYDVYSNGEYVETVDGPSNYLQALEASKALVWGAVWPRYECGCGGPNGQ